MTAVPVRLAIRKTTPRGADYRPFFRRAVAVGRSLQPPGRNRKCRRHPPCKRRRWSRLPRTVPHRWRTWRRGCSARWSTSRRRRTSRARRRPTRCRCRNCPKARRSRTSSTISSRTAKAGGGEGGAQKVQSLGSGFVVDAEQGIVVTNNHVIADADEIEVNFSDGSKLKAELVGTDTKTDIAVLKVDPKLKKLTAVKFGNSSRIRIGDWVMAIGNPFGLGGTVTVGIVSARNRDINAGPYDDFIQTDAAINRGNSGGPLFNMEGEVIGINTAIISPSGGSIGIGFSIPSELAVGVVDQLRRVRRDTPRLARRAHPAGDRRDCRKPRHGRRRRARWLPASSRAGRSTTARSCPATSSSSSTARLSMKCATCRASWPKARWARRWTW